MKSSTSTEHLLIDYSNVSSAFTGTDFSHFIKISSPSFKPMLSSPPFLACWRSSEGHQEGTKLYSVSEKGLRKITMRKSSRGNTEHAIFPNSKWSLVYTFPNAGLWANNSELLTSTISLVPVFSRLFSWLVWCVWEVLSYGQFRPPCSI